jgi:hypothetical protein
MRCTVSGMGKILDFLRNVTMYGAKTFLHRSQLLWTWPLEILTPLFSDLSCLKQIWGSKISHTWYFSTRSDRQVTITYWYWKWIMFATNQKNNVTNSYSFSCNSASKSNTLGNCKVYHVYVFTESDLESDNHCLKKKAYYGKEKYVI